LKAQLDKSNLTVAEAKALVKEIVTSSQIIQAKLADFSTKVTEAELKAKYQENPSAFDVATVRHILVKTSDPTTGKTFHTPEEALKLVKEAKDKLDKGGDWKEISKKYSEDDGSKDNGGQYKDAKISGWAPGFKEAASTQKIGVIGEPVESQHGYHVILVEKRSSTPYDKLTKEDKDGANGLRPSIASVKLNDYMTAEQEKIHLKVTLPKEPAASTDGTTNGGATNNATDNSATNSGAATNNAGSGNAATNGAATDNTAK
jgi:foldase protein PrsA